MADFPVLLRNPETALGRIDSRTFLHVGGIWGELKGGQTVNASDGPRFIWSADSLTVIYYQRGKFYVQSPKGFIGEVRTAPAVEAGRRSQFMARLAEIEMKLLFGILAGSSGAGFALVIGTEVAEFVVDNREDFEKWQRQLGAVLKARGYLKRFAPTLYDKVFDAVLHHLYRNVKSEIPDAITPEIIAFGVGVILGSVGKKMAQGKFSVLALVFVVLEQFFVRFSLSVVPGAFKLSANEYNRLAAEIIKKMQEAGVTIHEMDVRKIVEEVRLHPAEIKQGFQMLKEVFEKEKE
jgi:hypothetical protein